MPITDPKKRLTYFRQYRKSNKGAIQEKRQAWDSANPERIRTYTHTQRAKPSHNLKRLARKVAEKRRATNPSCSKCGRRPTGKDGRSLVQAHHTNYRSGNSVYLCAECHGKARMK